MEPKGAHTRGDESPSPNGGRAVNVRGLTAGSDRMRVRTWLSRWTLAAAYVGVSVLFVAVYFHLISSWTEPQLFSYTWGVGWYPARAVIFESRVLVPLIARAMSCALPMTMEWTFRSIAFLSVLASLFAYRRYLDGFLKPSFSGPLALALIYPMCWNYFALNRVYWPFDLPVVLLAVLGLYFMRRRLWVAYYAVLVLGLLNHVSAALLVPVFWLAYRGRMDARTHTRHVLFQVATVLAIKYVTLKMAGWESGEAGTVFRMGTYLRVNAGVLADMLTLRGNALKDWGKLLLSFGGLWLALPFLRRRLPRFFTAGLWAGVLYVFPVGCTAIIDEVRSYGVLIPIVLTPVIYAVARAFGGARPAEVLDQLNPEAEGAP